MINSAGEGSKCNLNRKIIPTVPITAKKSRVKKMSMKKFSVIMTIVVKKSNVIPTIPITVKKSSFIPTIPMTIKVKKLNATTPMTIEMKKLSIIPTVPITHPRVS